MFLEKETNPSQKQHLNGHQQKEKEAEEDLERPGEGQ